MSKENLKKLKGKIAAIGLATGLGASALAGCTPEDVEALQQYGIDVDVNTEDPTVEPTVEPTEEPTVEPTEEVKEEVVVKPEDYTIEYLLENAPEKMIEPMSLADYKPEMATEEEVYAKLAEIDEIAEELYNNNEELSQHYSKDYIRDGLVLVTLTFNHDIIDENLRKKIVNDYCSNMVADDLSSIPSRLYSNDLFYDLELTKKLFFDDVMVNECEIVSYYKTKSDEIYDATGQKITVADEILSSIITNEDNYFNFSFENYENLPFGMKIYASFIVDSLPTTECVDELDTIESFYLGEIVSKTITNDLDYELYKDGFRLDCTLYESGHKINNKSL